MAAAFHRAIRTRLGLFTVAGAMLFALMIATPVLAQGGSESVERYSLDSVIGVDAFGGQNDSNQPQVVFDISAAMRIGDNWQLYVRPWLYWLPRPASA